MVNNLIYHFLLKIINPRLNYSCNKIAKLKKIKTLFEDMRQIKMISRLIYENYLMDQYHLKLIFYRLIWQYQIISKFQLRWLVW